MIQLAQRKCVRCGKAFSPDGMTQKYCYTCGALVREEQRKAQYQRKKQQREEERRKRRTSNNGLE